MKTLEDLLKEISTSDELQNELASMEKGQYAEVEAFLKKHDCSASAEEFVNYLKSLLEGEIGDDEASVVAGGTDDMILFPEELPPLPPHVLKELELFKWF